MCEKKIELVTSMHTKLLEILIKSQYHEVKNVLKNCLVKSQYHEPSTSLRKFYQKLMA